MNRAIFMDRDGTVSEEIGYMYDAGLYKVFSWSGPAIRKINEHGMKAVLITNQSGVGRGYFDELSVHEVHKRLRAELALHHATLDGLYVCVHHPDAGCDCRKPNPGMLLQAQKDLDIDLAHSFIIGDKYLDIQTAHNVGAKGVLVLTGYGQEEQRKHQAGALQPDLVAANLMDAVDAILSGVLA